MARIWRKAIQGFVGHASRIPQNRCSKSPLNRLFENDSFVAKVSPFVPRIWVKTIAKGLNDLSEKDPYISNSLILVCQYTEHSTEKQFPQGGGPVCKEVFC